MLFSKSPDIEKLKARRNIRGLLKALKHKDKGVRKAAAEALGEIGEGNARDSLIPIVRNQDEDPGVRETSAKALGKMGGNAAVEALITVLGDVYEDVRETAARALGEIGDSRARQYLIDALQDVDEEWSMRVAAAEAVGQMLNAQAIPDVESQAIGLLIDIFRDDHAPLVARSAALRALGKSQHRRAKDTLVAALKDPEQGIRRTATMVVGEHGDAEAIDPLVAALKDQNDGVRLAAVEGLRKEGLKKIDGRRTVEPLVALLKDTNRDVCAKAMETLKEQKDDLQVVGCLIDTLVNAQNERNEIVCERAVEVLKAITGKDFGAVPGRWKRWSREQNKGVTP